MTDFILYALLAGIGVAIATGPLGCFVVWRRMAYFGDTLAHSALLGVAIGIFMDINLNVAIAGILMIFALLLGVVGDRIHLSMDTLLGILSHGSLAAGLVTMALLSDVRIDLLSLLFGDILAVTVSDLYLIYSISVIVMVLLAILWKPLLTMTVNAEMAEVEGYNITFLRIVLLLMTALVIAVAMKIVGVLLITALLVTPAATARRFSNKPEQMALFAAGIGVLSVVSGLSVSWYLDTPTGPSIVLCTVLAFLCSMLKRNA